MPKTEKVEKVSQLKERIEGSQAMFLADFRGLTVADVSDLRRSLRDSGTRVAVVKNTLMKRAAADAGAGDLEGLLQGPTAVAFVEGDPITAAKGLVDAMRRFRTLELKGGFMEGRVLSPAEAESLATIEPREVLLAKLAGLAKAEMSRAAYMFQALQSRFLAVLEAYREKVPGEAAAEETPGGGVPDEAEPEAAPVPEEQEEQPAAEPPEGARQESAPAGEESAAAGAEPAAGDDPAPAGETASEESEPAADAAGEETEGKE